eukprot:5562955-Amphidinium_carterae.1
MGHESHDLLSLSLSLDKTSRYSSFASCPICVKARLHLLCAIHGIVCHRHACHHVHLALCASKLKVYGSAANSESRVPWLPPETKAVKILKHAHTVSSTCTHGSERLKKPKVKQNIYNEGHVASVSYDIIQLACGGGKGLAKGFCANAEVLRYNQQLKEWSNADLFKKMDTDENGANVCCTLRQSPKAASSCQKRSKETYYRHML